MLLQTAMKPNDIISIKLVSGEELIAKLTSIEPGHVVITKPLMISLGQDRSGNVGIQMLPYFLLCGEPDAKLTISDAHILTKTHANDQAKNGYIQNTSGLTIAGANAPSGIVK